MFVEGQGGWVIRDGFTERLLFYSTGKGATWRVVLMTKPVSFMNTRRELSFKLRCELARRYRSATSAGGRSMSCQSIAHAAQGREKNDSPVTYWEEEWQKDNTSLSLSLSLSLSSSLFLALREKCRKTGIVKKVTEKESRLTNHRIQNTHTDTLGQTHPL